MTGLFHRTKKQIAIALLALSLLLTGCASTGTLRGNAAETWTLCLYLCGSNLESRQGWASETLRELTEAKIPKNVTVAVQTGGSRSWLNDTVTAGKNERWLVQKGALRPVESGDAASMGEADTLAGFLRFCAEQYPADRTAVVLWNHGGGPLQGACFDELQSFDALTLAELGEAFAAGVAARGGAKYDVVGFDACLMGSLETAAALEDDAAYLVASEEIEPGAGWDYAAALAAMGRCAAPEDVAKTFCDSYMEKCAQRGKDASATLAALDLSKTEAVCAALDAALAQLLQTRGSEVSALRRLAFCSRAAEGFGGATESEGLSNLLDLRGMSAALASDPARNGGGWDAVAQAVDAAVLHCVNGSATRGAGGLSIWYPRAFRAFDLQSYAAASPLAGYAGTLTSLFSASLGKITFSDAGSLTEDGAFSVSVAPEAQDAFYDLYVVNRRLDGDYGDVNVDMEDDWDTLTFVYDPRWAVGITLCGMVLDAQTIAYDYDHILFSCPVTLNGEKSNLRIAWFWDSEEDGHYELLGVWNGVDHVTGFSDRLQTGLSSGDVIGARSLETDEVRETVTLDGEPVIDEAPLEPGTYACWFVCLDLHGNEYPSSVATYQVTEEGTTILSIR